MENMKANLQRIVFFDGECHLCNGFVDTIITKDKTHIFQFAPLQGETAKALLPEQDRINLDTVIYFESGKIFHRSTAVLKILGQLDGVYKLSAVSWIIPGFLRDAVYKWVAKNRYAWFGKREFCRIPTPSERAYLLP